MLQELRGINSTGQPSGVKIEVFEELIEEVTITTKSVSKDSSFVLLQLGHPLMC